MVRDANATFSPGWLFAVAASVICWVACIRTWQVIQSDYNPGGQTIWPLPGLYLLEMAVLSLVGAFSAFNDRAEPPRDWGAVTWAVVGIFLAFAVMGAWSIGLFFLPTALMFAVGAILADRRRRRSSLVHAGIGVIAGLAQVALMLIAIRLFYPSTLF